MLLRHLSSPRLPLLIAALFAGGFVLLSACDSGGSGPPDGDDPEPPNRAPSVTAGATVASDSARLTAEASDPDGNLAALRLTGREGDFAVEAASVDSTAAIDTTVALDRFPVGVATIGAEATDAEGAAASDTARFAHEPDSLRVQGGQITDVFTGRPVEGAVELRRPGGEVLRRISTAPDGAYAAFTVPHLDTALVEVWATGTESYVVADTLRPGRFGTRAAVVDAVGAFDWLEGHGIDPGLLAQHVTSVNDDGDDTPVVKTMDWDEVEVVVYRENIEGDGEPREFLEDEVAAMVEEYGVGADDIIRYTNGRELPVRVTHPDSSDAVHWFDDAGRLRIPDNTVLVRPSSQVPVGSNSSRDLDEDGYIDEARVALDPFPEGTERRLSHRCLLCFVSAHSEEFGQAVFDLGGNSSVYDANETLFQTGGILDVPGRRDEALARLYNEPSYLNQAIGPFVQTK
jgi:hypothetical protein